MSFLVFRISTGELVADTGDPIYGDAYAGRGDGLNNPAMCDVHDVGPLPCGWYTIDPAISPETHLGPLAFPLIPDATNEMYGRNGFYIHGDNTAMNHSASDGCLILPHKVRDMIARGLGSGRLLVQAA